MIEAYAYLRVSGLGQVEGDGFDRQLLAIQEFAARNKYRIVRVFREEGVSGTKDLENRPELRELISSSPRPVLIEKLDRLARDLMIQETILADFTKRGIRLIPIMEPDLCSNDPSRKLIRQIMGAIAEYDRAMITMRMRSGLDRCRKRNGRCEGRKPYGFRDGEAKVKEAVKELRRSGMKLADIADILNSKGLKTRYGRQWKFNNVQKILHSRSA